MELTLPSSERATGWLFFEHGHLAGQRYSFETSVCPNPVCQCERMTLRCFPELSPPDSAPVCLEMDLRKREIADFDRLKSNPESLTMAKAVANEISQADWKQLWGWHLGAKRFLTQYADLDQIDAHFPADADSMVGYYEILPYATPIELSLGAQSWMLDDQYCVSPRCSCREAVFSFFELRPSPQPGVACSTTTPCIRYAYDTGQIEPLSDVRDGGVSGKDFVDALRQVLPDLDLVMAKRQALLRRLYRRAQSRKTIGFQAPKPGRNDSCPCGSGKKYKKCCGA
jgi:SEC-C motif